MAGAVGVFGFVGAASPAIYYRDSKCGVDRMSSGYVENGCTALFVGCKDEVCADGVCGYGAGDAGSCTYSSCGSLFFGVERSQGNGPAEVAELMGNGGDALGCDGGFR